MNVSGQVISVSLETQARKQDGGVYPAWELIFKGRDGKVQSITKHINGLKYTKGLKEALESLSPGDSFTVVMEKNGAYNEVKEIVKGEFAAVATPPSAATPSTGRVTGSNYETPAERAARQRLIVRQSSLSNALQFFEVTKGKPSVGDVVELAERFTDFVFEQDETPESE